MRNKDLQDQLLQKIKELELLADEVGPTPLRRRLSDLVVSTRLVVRDFDQDEYERGGDGFLRVMTYV